MHRSMTGLASAILIVANIAPLYGRETYRQASIDHEGQLRIVTASGRQIVPAKEASQIGFDAVAVAADGRAVGWLALFSNCCTSYPIPLKLVVLANGRQRTFTGVGLPVWRWAFADGGKRVAFSQETVHGGGGAHFELRDIDTGRLISAYDPAPDHSGEPPSWVRAIDATR